MKTLIKSLLAGSFTLIAGVASAQVADQADQIIRGRYQAVLGDCAACHTKPGGRPFAGGAPLETPFGPIVPPNITPHATGIGDWSLDDFRRMMRTGTGHDGKRLYPAMPYTNYTMMPRKDVDDLWAYLTTLEPVDNFVEANQLPFPFNIRLSMWGWNLLNFEEKDFRPDPNKSPEWNRGAYIVQGPGHCGTCHTPRTLTGADDTAKFLQGASLQGWYAPNITAAQPNGIGDWSEDELVQYLKTGVNDRTIVSGPMAEAIQDSTSQMTDGDLRAIAVYLKSLEPKSERKASPKPADDRMARGQDIYNATCLGCHGGEGKGASQLFPALAGNSIVMQDSSETLARLVLEGSQAGHTAERPTSPAMPALGWRLNDQQIADVLTYVRNSWGNSATAPAAGDVSSVRKQLGLEPSQARR